MRCRVSDRYLMYAGGFMSPMQRCFSGLSSSTIGDILRHRRLSLAMLHAWTLEYQHITSHDALRLMVDTYEGRKTSWRRPPGRPRNVWLNKIQEDANALLLSTLWRSEIAMGHR